MKTIKLIPIILLLIFISCKHQNKEVKPSIVFSYTETYFEDNEYNSSIIDSTRYSTSNNTFNIIYYTFKKRNDTLEKVATKYTFRNKLIVETKIISTEYSNYNSVETNSLNYNFSSNGYYNTVIVFNNKKFYNLSDKKKYGYVLEKNRM